MPTETKAAALPGTQEKRDARWWLEAIMDIWADLEKAPEHRCYVDGALGATMTEAAAHLRASEGRVPEGHAIVNLWDLKFIAEMREEDWPGQGAGAAELSEHWFKAFNRKLDKAKELHRAAADSVTAAPHPPAQQAEPTVTIETAVLHMGMTVFWSQLVEAMRADGFDLGEGKVKAGPAMIAFVKRETETLLKANEAPPHKAEGAEPTAVVETAAKARAWDKCRASCVIRDAPLTIGDVIDTMDALLAQELSTTQEPSA